MQRKVSLMKKLFNIQMIFIILLTMIFSITLGNVKVQAVSQSKVSGIDAFPDSYKNALRELANNHPNWTFTAYNTGINWQDFMNGECYPINKNTIQSKNPLYIANNGYDTGGGFYTASPGAIAYYADPRNFLTEDRNISIYGNVIQCIST